MKLSGKRILLISDQSWDHIKLSKHHYAMELAKLGNEVYYLRPPNKNRKYVKFVNTKITKNLYVIENSLFLPYKLKFHFPFLFNLLMSYQVKKINKHCGKIDIIWSFSILYTDLKKFNADLRIYHLMDMLHDKEFTKTGNSSDFIFGVTKSIISKFDHKNKFLINHGLSHIFLKNEYNPPKPTHNPINVGYCGNLNVESLDRKLILTLVEKNPSISFHFIGPNSPNDSSVDFINQLKSSVNVTFYGKLSPEEISKIYIDIDAFILCYDKNSTFSQNRNASSNSHKLLEYISTGKVVISTNMSSYQSNEGIIEMLEDSSNENYLKLFNQVINNLSFYNSKEKYNKRFKFAEQNSYKNRIKEIEKIITNIEY